MIVDALLVPPATEAPGEVRASELAYTCAANRHVLGVILLFAAVKDFPEPHLGMDGEGFVSVSDFREMAEDILAAVIRLDKAEAFVSKQGYDDSSALAILPAPVFDTERAAFNKLARKLVHVRKNWSRLGAKTRNTTMNNLELCMGPSGQPGQAQRRLRWLTAAPIWS
jgi:hypothetical protein